MTTTTPMESHPAAANRKRWMVAPREHGAWGLILQPFVAASVLANHWNWQLAAGLAVLLGAFLSREPLLILARQRWVWKDRKPDTEDAIRSISIVAPVVALCGASLLLTLPVVPMLALGGLGAAMTVLGTWMGVTNRQRSTGLQMVSSLGLGAGAHLAALAATGRIDGWVWVLWAYLTVHAISGIQLIHVRLGMRIAATAGRGRASASRAKFTVLGVAVLAAAIGVLAAPVFALPLAATSVLHGAETVQLGRLGALSERLTAVGFRNLGWALVQMTITIVVLRLAWPGL